MSRRLAVAPLLALLALAVVPAAAADGPMPYTMQDGSGVAAPDGLSRFVAVGASENTALEQIQTSDGTVRRSYPLFGSWGVPVTTYAQGGEGLSANGRTLVLGDTVASYPRTMSRFLVFDTKRFRPVRAFFLRGDFAFDALSPDGARLYLFQHTDANNMQRYVVRAYDVGAGRLLPGRIADRTQKGWVMQGWPVARATSAGGRWVYTLCSLSFVRPRHDSRRRPRVGLPWHGSQNGFYNMRLSLRSGDRSLAVHWLSGRPWLRVDTSTWAVAPDRRTGLPWLGIGAAGAAVLLAGAALLLVRRRRRAAALEQCLAELLRTDSGTRGTQRVPAG
jgi:hypothetical protein